MILTLRRKATDKFGTTSFKAHPSRLAGTVYFRKQMFRVDDAGNAIIPETITVESDAFVDPVSPEISALEAKKAEKANRKTATAEEKAAAKAARKALTAEGREAKALQAKADRAAKAVQKATEKANALRIEAEKAKADREALAESRTAAATEAAE